MLAVGVLAGTSAPASAATTASFSSGVLSVFGDANANMTVIGRDAPGNILVNGGAVVVSGGAPTVANTSLIQVFGHGGADVITLNDADGALPAAHLFGGGGNDTIDGGTGANIVLDSLTANTVRSATNVRERWLAVHARTVNGKTVLKAGSQERTIPRARLALLSRPM